MALTKDVMRQIPRLASINLGSDPELFLATKGQVIGAEKVIPQEGLSYNGMSAGRDTTQRRIVLDGVQVELHPRPGTCRALIANDFKAIFMSLKAQLDKKGASASFNPVVTVSKEEMKTLSKAAQELGCAPSKNIYDPNATIKVPKGFRMRSAGGHIHAAFQHYDAARQRNMNANATPEGVERFVKICDLFLGIPGVLLDRDPQAAVRRKVYGRASEHRTPPHGIEYRVLSNYWLRSYQLMSFVYGMTRQAANVWMKHPLVYNGGTWDASAELFSRVDFEKVRKAINTNNADLAWKQWAGVASFIDEFCIDSQSGLWTGESLEAFEFFAKKTQENGIQYWFPEDPLEHWCNIPEGHSENAAGYAGWESYLIKAVADKRNDGLIDDVISRLTAPIVIAPPKAASRKRVAKKVLTLSSRGGSVASLATKLISNEARSAA